MRKLFLPVWEYSRGLVTGFLSGWDRFWFTPADPTVLAFIRICTGLVLTYIYLTCLGEVQNFVGPDAWIDSQAIGELSDMELMSKLFPGGSMPEQMQPMHHWNFKFPAIYVLVQNRFCVELLYGFFLVGMICLTLGVFSRAAAVVAWIGHLSFVQRSFLTWFGMDAVLAMLTLYVMIGPSGAVWSLDNLFRRYDKSRRALGDRGQPPRDESPAPSWTANLAVRLIQIHMSIIYVCSGCSKLQGQRWWDGTAVWYTMNIPEFQLVDSRWMATIPWMAWFPLLMSNIAVGLTIIFEIGFPFLIYVRVLRPLTLFVGLGLHAAIGIFIGLGGFGAAMLTGLSSFLNPTSLRWCISVILKGQTGYRFVYDHHDPGHVSLASWLYAADAWQQVELVPATAAGAGAPAGSLIAPNGTVLQGWAAFRRLVWSIRTLWLLWPVVFWQFATLRGESISVVAGKR